MGRGEDSLSGQGPAGVLGGQTPPQYRVPRGGGGDRLWLLPGVRVGRGRRVRRWEWRLGGEDGPAGGLLVASGVRQGWGFRVEGEARSDLGWPALARCLAELARVALWLVPRLRVNLLRLLGRCTVLAERVFAAAEDWGTEEIVTRFLVVLGEMTEDAFESLAHLGTSPRPTPRRRLFPMRFCVGGWGKRVRAPFRGNCGTSSSRRVSLSASAGCSCRKGRVTRARRRR